MSNQSKNFATQALHAGYNPSDNQFGSVAVPPVSYTHLDVYKRQILSRGIDTECSLSLCNKLFLTASYSYTKATYNNRHESIYGLPLRHEHSSERIIKYYRE